MTLRIHLPDGGTGFTLDGDQALDQAIAGTRVQRKAAITGGLVTVEDRLQKTGAEIAPTDIAGERARLATAQRRLLRISTATNYPAPWVAIAIPAARAKRGVHRSVSGPAAGAASSR